ncbi:MAG: 3'-5' exonuclease [Thiotrichales bacterium]|nr:3'-5' exonuclease [Thiotrichales bacterium]
MAFWHRLMKLPKIKSLKDSNYAFLFTPTVPGDYVCFDCESTGLNPRTDRIITLSALRIREGEILSSQALELWLAQPQRIAPESIKVHQIRNQDLQLQEGPLLSEQEAMSQFLHFIQGATLVGYYVTFDIALVERIVQPWLGVRLPNPRLDVSELYYRHKAKHWRHGIYQSSVDLRFSAILADLQLPNLGQHQAFNDALMTALIFCKLQRLGDERC